MRPPTTTWALRAALPAVLLLLTGCALRPLPPPIWRIGPGGATPGLAASDVRHPNTHETMESRVIAYDPDRVRIDRWYQRDGLSYNVTGSLPGAGDISLVGERDSGYQAAYEEILQRNDLDGLLNQVVDTRGWMLNLYIIKFTNIRTVVGGTGYRLVDSSDRELLPHATETGASQPAGTGG